MAFQRLKPDGRILLEDGSAAVTKIAVEPVWWLPGVARRFGVSEAELPRALRGDRRHVPGAGHPQRHRGLPAADRRQTLYVSATCATWPIRR